MPGSISVALVDDQSLFRAGIRMLIESQTDLSLAGEASDGAEGVELARTARPDVMLMDVRMPRMSGIDATSRILADSDAAGRTPPKIIVLTTFELDDGAARALKMGASGFLLKDSQPEFLLASIRSVYSGNAVIAPGATRSLFAQFTADTGPAPIPEEYAALTERERQVFLLAASGLSNSEIAAREYLSEATVKTHISRVLNKLGARDRVQLVIYGYEHGLVG